VSRHHRGEKRRFFGKNSVRRERNIYSQNKKGGGEGTILREDRGMVPFSLGFEGVVGGGGGNLLLGTSGERGKKQGKKKPKRGYTARERQIFPITCQEGHR